LIVAVGPVLSLVPTNFVRKVGELNVSGLLGLVVIFLSRVVFEFVVVVPVVIVVMVVMVPLVVLVFVLPLVVLVFVLPLVVVVPMVFVVVVLVTKVTFHLRSLVSASTAATFVRVCIVQKSGRCDGQSCEDDDCVFHCLSPGF
jgi:hypothetical protein